jgi:hypothetical protein
VDGAQERGVRAALLHHADERLARDVLGVGLTETLLHGSPDERPVRAAIERGECH